MIRNINCFPVNVELEASLRPGHQGSVPGRIRNRLRLAYLHLLQIESCLVTVKTECLCGAAIVVDLNLDMHPPLFACQRCQADDYRHYYCR